MSIATIMAGVKALAPTYDSDVVFTVWGYDEIKDTLSEAECPMRMLIAPVDEVGAEMETSGIGGATQTVRWSILDRAYLFPVMLDQGIENYSHRIYQYIESYNAAIKANRCLSTTNASVSYVSFNGPYYRAYPDVEGNPVFWVVDAQLTVEEFI